MNFMKSGMLIKVLRVLGWLIIMAGLIVGIWASYQLGQQVSRTEWGRWGPSAGEIFMAFLVPSLIGFLSSIGSFWMAAVLENQERTLEADRKSQREVVEALKKNQSEIVETLKKIQTPPSKPSEPKYEKNQNPTSPTQTPEAKDTNVNKTLEITDSAAFRCKGCGKELHSGELCSRCARNQAT
ncbi:MAG: hypothetical protein FWB98_05800 [Defluviitaleaceae bacterium]|nr:hypothetical protein [Defluviitaleaceae bacterium]